MAKFTKGMKVLVKKDYKTGGGEEFHRDAKCFQTEAAVVCEVDEGSIYVKGRTRAWYFRPEDLLPYRPVQLENK